MKKFHCIMAGAALLFFSGCDDVNSTKQIPTVTPFSVHRFLGTWQEAARMPHWFEKDMEYVTAEYSIDKSGVIRVRNKGMVNGTAKSIEGYVRQKKQNSGELEVSFFRPFYGKYRIIALDKDYSAALITSSTKDYAWILVRDQKASEKFLAAYVLLLKKLGYDCSRLIYPEMLPKKL